MQNCGGAKDTFKSVSPATNVAIAESNPEAPLKMVAKFCQTGEQRDEGAPGECRRIVVATNRIPSPSDPSRPGTQDKQTVNEVTSLEKDEDGVEAKGEQLIQTDVREDEAQKDPYSSLPPHSTVQKIMQEELKLQQLSDRLQ